jgi:hypothetical protein
MVDLPDQTWALAAAVLLVAAAALVGVLAPKLAQRAARHVPQPANDNEPGRRVKRLEKVEVA